MGKLVHYLGKPSFYFNPCDYGDYKEAYTKRTCLWGKFNKPKPRNRIEPVKAPDGHHSIDKYILQQGIRLSSVEKRSAIRSITPKGFARAFFEVNQ